MIFGTKYMLMEEDPSPETPAGSGDTVEQPLVLDGNTPEPEAAPEPTGVVAEGWLAGVENEWATDKSLEDIKDMNSLVKTYVNAQRLIGRDKVSLPTENATDEERREFLYKLGLPREKEGYQLKVGEEAAVNEDFVNGFKEKAYELGMLPDKAQEMLDWYDQTLSSIVEQDSEQYVQDVEATVSELKSEYGAAYDSKINLANTVLSKIVDEDTMESMKDSGMVNDKAFIQAMVKVGEMFAQEDGFDFKPRSEAALTPSEAQRQIDTIQGNYDHPYHKPQHPAHQSALDDMAKLFKFIG